MFPIEKAPHDWNEDLKSIRAETEWFSHSNSDMNVNNKAFISFVSCTVAMRFLVSSCRPRAAFNRVSLMSLWPSVSLKIRQIPPQWKLWLFKRSFQKNTCASWCKGDCSIDFCNSPMLIFGPCGDLFWVFLTSFYKISKVMCLTTWDL